MTASQHSSFSPLRGIPNQRASELPGGPELPSRSQEPVARTWRNRRPDFPFVVSAGLLGQGLI